jgi:tetratricopeptide (TPR) repeat protein
MTAIRFMNAEDTSSCSVVFVRAPMRFFAYGILAVAAASCSKCASCRHETDAELAAKERKKADEEWRGSISLLPWRALKGAVRSAGAPNRPPFYAKVDATMAVLEGPVGAGEGAEAAAKQRTSAAFELLGYLVLHRDELVKHDEDEFPRLANLWTETQPPLPAPWYDDAAEHLMTALGMLLLDAADKGDRVPAGDIVFYELSRADAQPAWPAEVRLIDEYARGLTYLSHDYFFAAQEELTRYLDEVEKTAPGALLALVDGGAGSAPDGAKTKDALLAAGYFTRGYDRMKLDRDDPATEDFEKALDAVHRLGADDELTLWASAYVHQRRGKYDEAARDLETLAASPYIDAETKKDVLAAAAEMKKHGDDPGWFHAQRTTAALVRAAVARAGGPERLLGFAIGEERAHQVFSPLAAMSDAGAQLRAVAEREKGKLGGLGEGATQAGKKALGGLREDLADAASR